MKDISIRLALVSLLAACSANANDAALLESVKNAFQQNAPKYRVVSVSKAPLAGLYELVLEGNHIVYVDQQANYLIIGNLLDLKKNISLTTEKERELSRVDWKSLPLNLAMKEVRGKGTRKLAVFTDPDCSYCKQLEQGGLKGLTDVTIYTFLYPLVQIHPNALHKSKQIWCAQDKLATWTAYIRDDKPLSGAGDCATPIDEIQALGKRLAITGTPTLIFANGQREAGALSSRELEALLAK